MTVDQVRRKIYGLWIRSIGFIWFNLIQVWIQSDWDLIADTNLIEGTSWLHPFAENITTHQTMPLRETFVETLVRHPDDWGNIPNTFIQVFTIVWEDVVVVV